MIGLCAAHYLERAGADVLVVEKGRFGAGCSHGNGGWVCPSISTPVPSPGLTRSSLRWMLRSDSPLYIRPSAVPGLARWLWAFRSHCNEASYANGVRALGRLNVDTAWLYDELAQSGVRFERRTVGTLLAFSDAAALEASLAELAGLAPFGVGPVDRVDRSGLAELEPDLEGDLVGGLLVRSDLHVRPESLCCGLVESLGSRGVELVEDVEVGGFARDGDRVRAAVTEHSDIEADEFLLCAGAHTGRLAGSLGFRLPMQAGKGYSITVEEPRARLRHPVYLAGAKMGFTPFDGAIRTLGTMELSGINARLDPRRLSALERGARRHLPGALEGARRVDWVGMRPVLPDGLPAIGRIPGTRNALVAAGHQMLGVTLAPSTGRSIARLIVDGASEHLTPFDPARF